MSTEELMLSLCIPPNTNELNVPILIIFSNRQTYQNFSRKNPEVKFCTNEKNTVIYINLPKWINDSDTLYR